MVQIPIKHLESQGFKVWARGESGNIPLFSFSLCLKRNCVLNLFDAFLTLINVDV